MKRHRPYIPLSVCVQVAERQISMLGNPIWPIYQAAQAINPWPLGQRLRVLLNALFEDRHYQLDHDPALILRKFRNDARLSPAARYTPNANDPNHLVYRDTADHLQKTTGRKPGAAKTIHNKGSDIGLKAKFNKLEGRTKQRLKAKIPSRPFPIRTKKRGKRS